MPSKLAAARASREASERLGGGPATAPRRAASGQSGLPSEMEDHSKDDPTKTFARMSQRRRGSLESQPNAQQQHLSAKLATDAPASGQSVTFHVSSGAHGQHGTPTATAAALAGAQAAAAAAAAGDASGAAGTPSRSVSPGNTAPAVRPHGALHTLVTPGLGSGHSPRMGSVGRLPSASGSSARLPTMAVGLGPGGVPLRAASAALPDACVGGVVGHAEGSGSALWGGVPETSGSTLPPSSAAFTQPSASQSQLQPAVAMAGHRPELVGAGGGTGGHVLLDSAPEGLAGMAAHNTGTELGMGSVSGTQLQDIVPVSGVSAGGVSGSGGVGGMPGSIQALPSAAIPTAMPATASAAAAAVAAAGARASSGTAFSAAAAAAASVSGEQAWTGSLNTAAPPAAERSKSSSTQATTPVRQSRLRVSVGRQGPEAAGAGAGRVGASGVGAVSTDMSLDAGESLARTSPQPEQLPPGPGLTSPAVAWPTTAARAGSGLSAVSSSAGGTPAGVSRHTSAVGLRHGRTGLAGHGSGTLAASSATAGAGAAGAAARELFHTTSLGPANSGAGVGVGSEEPPSPSVASSFTMRQTPSDVEDELMERMRARGGLGLGLSGARLAAAGGSGRMTAGGAAGGGGGAVSVSARPSETGTSGGMAVGLSSAGLLMHTADGAAAVSATAGHLDGGSPAHRLSGGVPPGGYMPSVGERGGGTAAGVRVPIRLNHQPGHQRRLPNRHASMPATKQDSAAAAAVLGAAASHRAAAAAAAAAAARQQQQHDSGTPGELMAADPAVVSGAKESSLHLRVLDVTDVGAVSGQAISGSGAIGGGATGSGEGGHLTSGASHLHLLSHNNSSVLAPGGVSATLSRWAPTSPELCSTGGGGGGGAAAPGGAAGPALVPVALPPAAAAGSGFGMRGAVGSGTGAGGMGNGVSALIGNGGGLSPISGGPHQLPSPPEAESEPYDTQLVMRPPPPGGRMPQLRHALGGGGGDRGGTDDGSAAAGVPGGGGGGSSSRATPAFLGGRSASGSGNNGRALASAMAAATATGGGSGQQHQVPQALMSSQQSGFFVDRPSHPSGRMLMSGAHATAAAAAAHNSGLAALHKAVERLMLQDSGLYSKVQASMKGISSLAKETNKLEFVRDASGATVINQYVVVKTLGRGAFGKVKLCLNTLDGQLYAVKMINRAHLLRQLQKPARPLRRRAPPPRNTSDTGLMHGVMHRTATESNLSICNTNGSSFGNVAQAALPARASMDDASPLAAIMREIAVMKKVDHPHVVRLHEVIDPPGSNYLMMVMEYCEGGCVMETRQQTGLAPLGEEAARESFRQACLGLDYLHYNNVVHGDMKPENMLVSGSGVLKIADFGSSRFMGGDPGDATKTSCTPAFQSPEEISHLPVDPFAADVWALGCCLYTFVFGRLPFVGSCVVDIYRAILTRPHTYPSPAELPHSAELRDLLDRMLHKDPARRLQLKDVMQHPWVTGHGTLPPLVCLQTLAATVAAANQFSIGGAAGGTDGGASPGAAAAAAPPAVVLPPVIRVTHAEQVNAIDRSSLVSLIRARLKEKICSPGEYLFKEGDEAHCVYMIMAGVVELTQHLRRPPPGYPGGGTSAGPAGERRGAAAVAAAAAAAAASGSGDPDHDHDASFSVDLDESLTLDHMEGMHFTDAMNIVDGKLHIDRQQAIEMRRRMQGQLLGDNAEYVVEVKGPGSVIGEMGMEATATVTHRMSARARGPVTVVKLTEENFFKALLQMYGGGGGGGSQASTSITASSISEALTKANGGGGGGGGAHGGAPPPAPSSYAGSGAGGPGGGAPGLSAQHLMVMQYLEDSGSHAMFGPTGAPLGGGGHGHGGGHVSGTAGGRYSLDSAARPTLVRPGVVGGVGSGASVHPLNAAAAVQSSLYAAGSPVRAAGSPLGLGPGAGGGAQGAAGVQWVAVSGAGVAAGGAAGGGPGSGHHHPHHHHNHHQQGTGARSNGGSAHGGGAPAFSAAAVDRFGRGGAAPRVPPGAAFGGGGSGGEEGAAPMGLGAGAVAAHRAMALLGGASKSSLNAHSHLGVLNTIHSINASRAGGNTSEEGIADL